MKIILRFQTEEFECELHDEIEGSILDNIDEIGKFLDSIKDKSLLGDNLSQGTYRKSIYEKESKTDGKEVIPLDLFLQKYDTDVSQPQKRTLAVGLYLTEVLKMVEFKTKEISEILQENRMSPIDSISTHGNRLRKKGLISIKSSGGKEIVMRIFKDKNQEIEAFLKKE